MKYALFFRGINVGGKNIVKMNELTKLLLELGLNDVKTYIQSGNAVVETDLEEKQLHDIVYNSFEDHFGFKSPMKIRNMDEMKSILDRFPMTEQEIAAAEAADLQVEHIYVYLLDYVMEQTQIDDICKDYNGPDIIRIGKREAYFLCHQSIRDSKLAIRTSKILESATVRNWKTMNKLYDMMIS